MRRTAMITAAVAIAAGAIVASVGGTAAAQLPDNDLTFKQCMLKQNIANTSGQHMTCILQPDGYYRLEPNTGQ